MSFPKNKNTPMSLRTVTCSLILLIDFRKLWIEDQANARLKKEKKSEDKNKT